MARIGQASLPHGPTLLFPSSRVCRCKPALHVSRPRPCIARQPTHRSTTCMESCSLVPSPNYTTAPCLHPFPSYVLSPNLATTPHLPCMHKPFGLCPNLHEHHDVPSSHLHCRSSLPPPMPTLSFIFTYFHHQSLSSSLMLPCTCTLPKPSPYAPTALMSTSPTASLFVHVSAAYTLNMGYKKPWKREARGWKSGRRREKKEEELPPFGVFEKESVEG